jgi:chromosome segregation ATPase
VRDLSASAERTRHAVAETREREATERAMVRQAEESVAQLTARRQALEELERDRVGLAPAAAALLGARDRFGGAVLGPLSDFLSTDRADAELAERLLGESVHAVLVRDWAAVEEIQRWHADAQPGALVLLPVEPGPTVRAPGPHPLSHRLRVDAPAAAWVDALVGGSEVIESTGRVLRRASGAVFLGGAAGPTGPIRRRADLAQLGIDVERQESALGAARASLLATTERLAQLEREAEEAAQSLARAQEAERQAIGVRDDTHRLVANLRREAGDSEQQLQRVQERLAQAERRLADVDALLTEGEMARVRSEETLATARAALAALEADQESARETRLQWQVQEAHLGARMRAASDRLDRMTHAIGETDSVMAALREELTRLDAEETILAEQQRQW